MCCLISKSQYVRIKIVDVKIKKLNQDAVIPTYAKSGDAGMDITAVSKSYDDHGNVVYGTGLAFEIPEGYVGLLFPRSSNTKKDLVLGNSVGVLDSGYRGEVVFKFKPSLKYMTSFDHYHDGYREVLKTLTNDQVHLGDGYQELLESNYDIGDRIGQIIIMPIPKINFVEVDELSDSDRGAGGFGSSGK
jgi:dUTP pyrophosphatase